MLPYAFSPKKDVKPRFRLQSPPTEHQNLIRDLLSSMMKNTASVWKVSISAEIFIFWWDIIERERTEQVNSLSNLPKYGLYGIFAENMLETAQSVAEENLKEAS